MTLRITPQKVSAEDSARYFERDLSWLQFNQRVLCEAQDESNPLLERLKFLAITCSNLDEFFMIRLAALEREIHALRREPERNSRRLKFYYSLQAQLQNAVQKFVAAQYQTFAQLCSSLSKEQVLIVREPLTAGEEICGWAKLLYQTQVRPFLETPNRLSNTKLRSLFNLQMAVILETKHLLAVPLSLPGVFVHCVSEKSLLLFFLDDLLRAFCREHSTSEAPAVIRLTRDADIVVDLRDEDPQAVPDLVRSTVHARQQRKPVRLQVTPGTELTHILAEQIRLPLGNVFSTRYPLALGSLVGVFSELSAKLKVRPKLFFHDFTPCIPEDLSPGADVFNSLNRRDYFLHHPYDSFDAYLVFLEQAVNDTSVTEIQQTFYRVDALSKAVELLAFAARSKRVRVFIELRARFDEVNNAQLAETLKRAGAEVVFCSGPLKVHAKLTSIARQEGGKTRYYTHLSSGNYNARTARVYTDMAIITAHQGIGADARVMLDSLATGVVPEALSFLLLAPTGLHKRIISLIRTETAAARRGERARIVAKTNALVDRKVIEELYQASQAGVKIELIVRGACALRPGVKGMSENIIVRSIVDRFLEHSRLYYFENSQKLYLSSADWMPRNFFSRLEIAFPVLDPRIYQFLAQTVLPAYLQDNVKAWNLTSKGKWQRAHLLGQGAMRSQGYFLTLAKSAYRHTALAVD